MERDNNISSSVSKYITDDFNVLIVSNSKIQRHYISAQFDHYDDPDDLLKLLEEYISSKDVKIVAQTVFGSSSYYDVHISSLNKIFSGIEWPITWIESQCYGNNKLTAIQLIAISGVSLEPIRLNEKIIGNYFEYEDAQICFLGGLLPTNIKSTNAQQAEDVFIQMEKALNLVGMDFSNVIRTWLYINNILDWYDEFNKVRTEFFNKRRIFEGLVPASTGVGVANHKDAALVTELIAVKGKSNLFKVEEVKSPLQCSAMDYKSSFSRAVEVRFSDYRRLYISGTASINSSGKTVFIENTEKQISQTMDVATAILKSRNMDWNDITRAIAYFPDINSSSLFKKYCLQQSISLAHIVITHGDICRSDLLFEIEVDAVKIL